MMIQLIRLKDDHDDDDDDNDEVMEIEDDDRSHGAERTDQTKKEN